MNWYPYKKRENVNDYLIEVKVNPQPKHPDKLEFIIILFNEKTRELIVKSDSSHPPSPKGGKWPFHIHNPNSKGIDMFLGNNPWEYHKIFLAQIEKDDRLTKEEKTQIQNKLEMIWPEKEIQSFYKEFKFINQSLS
ncbi:MAG: hypothetical protein MUO73_00260 [Thermoplasmata archaeon]|nr:hypothetical protein [Thermoplasmata archaeon]